MDMGLHRHALGPDIRRARVIGAALDKTLAGEDIAPNVVEIVVDEGLAEGVPVDGLRPGGIEHVVGPQGDLEGLAKRRVAGVRLGEPAPAWAEVECRRDFSADGP